MNLAKFPLAVSDRAWRSIRLMTKASVPVLLTLGMVEIGSATTILSVPDTTFAFIGLGQGSGDSVLDSWTQSFTLTNATITAFLEGNMNGGAMPSNTLDAYLMTQVGSGTTVADQVAAAVLSIPDTEQTDTLFTGLNLGPGTYYLVLSDSSVTDGWAYVASSNAQTAPGVTFNGLEDGGISGYVPSNSFQPYLSEGGSLSVSGTVIAATPVPEPSAMWIVGFAITALGVIRRKVNTPGYELRLPPRP